jgi:hypothetical protein
MTNATPRWARIFAKSDTVDLPIESLAFIITTAGDLQVTDMSGSIVIIPDVPAGVFEFVCTRVWSTNTTAVVTCVLG